MDVHDRQHLTKLYISNIPRQLYSYSKLRQHFERFGKVKTLFLNDNKKFGHVTFYNHENAKKALDRASYFDDNWKLVIQWWENYSQRRPRNSRENGDKKMTGNDEHSSNATPLHDGLEKANNEAASSMAGLNIISPLYWKNIDILPAPVGTRCLLVNNTDEFLPPQNIKMHFENKRRSGGGPVQSIARLVDGILVVFKNESDCKSALSRRDHTIDGTPIKIYQKLIPGYYEDRFIVSNIRDNTITDTLELYLESCSKNETCPSVCDKTDYAGVFQIQYGKEFGTSETADLLKNINSKPLEGQNLKASRLLRTDCLKVSNLHPDISNHVIQLFFENKKRSSGGTVTKVDRLQNHLALVYFASFEDAENVAERFKGSSSEPALIQKQKVNVKLYFHCFENIHERRNSAVRCENTSQTPNRNKSEQTKEKTEHRRPLLSPFYRNIGTDDLNIQFICSTPVHRKKFEERCKEFASVQISWKGNLVKKITFKPKNQTGTHKDFNLKCQNEISNFVLNYTSFIKEFDEDILERGRNMKVCPEVSKSFTAHKEESDVKIRWIKNRLEVTGLKQASSQMLKHITKSLSFSSVKMQIKADQYEILNDCKILDEVSLTHKTVHMSNEPETKTISISGPELDVANFQTKTFITLNMMEKVRLELLNIQLRSFLIQSIQDRSNVISVIQENFKQADIKATLQTYEGEVFVIAKTLVDCQNAENIVRRLLILSIVTVEDWSIVTSSAWLDFKKSLKLKNLELIEEQTLKRISLCGFSNQVAEIEQKIEKYIEKNRTMSRLYPMKYGKAKFILEKTAYLTNIMGISCCVSNYNGGGILIKGLSKSVENAIENIRQALKTVIETKETFSEYKVWEYFNETEGKSFISETENFCQCVILTSFNKEDKRTNSTDLCRTTSPRFLQCKVTLVEGDITDQRASEIWVYATAPEYLIKMNGSAISKALSRAMRLDESMFAEPYFAGDVLETTGGCWDAEIYHALITYYDEKTAKDLIQKIVMECLQNANYSEYSSICFTAIGTGGYGYPASSVANWMKETFMKFYGQYLRNIFIVLFPKNTEVIKAFKDVFSTPFEILTEYKENLNSKQCSATKIGSIMVSVYCGEAANERSDIVASVHKLESFKLPCKKWIEIHQQKTSEEVRNKMLSLLKLTSDQNFSSISVCGLCSEYYNNDEDDASAIRVAIETFAKLYTQTSVTYINLVTAHKQGLKTLKDGIFMKTSEVISDIPDLGIPNWLLPVPLKYTFDVYIYSNSSENNVKAYAMLRSKVSKEIIKDDTICRLTSWERKRIQEIEKDLKITISYSNSSQYLYGKKDQITVEGLKTDVSRAHDSIKSILQDFVAAETCATFVKWQKLSSHSSKTQWTDLPLHANYAVEKAYKEWVTRSKSNYANSITTSSIFVHTIQDLYQIDFEKVEADPSGLKSTGIRRKIIEQAKSHMDFPAHWDIVAGSTTFEKIRLSSATSEYKIVLGKFKSSGIKFTKTRIYRIQNSSLYKQYIAKRQEVNHKLKRSSYPIERELFHGTTEWENIIHQGFDKGFCGKNAISFGKGAYFATESAYAHLFTKENSKRFRFMILADVITGEYCQGKPEYKAPPPNPRLGSKTELYDSVVNNNHSPSIFVIFKDASAYPAYLIAYT
uniref:uncharacterized protein LOC120335126 isoform X2 n=1 Tax=Styela clava TaxID=7725 RepID=UPI001939EDF0|nr:uncharacterized protein LOC120335126 isoform X2 [Styela clava]